MRDECEYRTYLQGTKYARRAGVGKRRHLKRLNEGSRGKRDRGSACHEQLPGRWTPLGWESYERRSRYEILVLLSEWEAGGQVCVLSFRIAASVIVR